MLGLFGGILDYNKMGWMAQKTAGQLWRKMEEAGFEKKDGIYDTRDFEAIRSWAKELAQKVRQNVA